VNKRLLLLFIFFFVFFSLPQLLRFALYSPSIIGTTPYFHIRMAELLLSGQAYDSLSFGGRYYTYPPAYHWLLAISPLKYLLNPFIGALGVVLLYFIARELGFSEESALFSSALLGFIPGYLYLSGHINPRMPALFFLMLTFLFLLKSRKDKRMFYLSFLSMPIVFLIHPLVGAVAVFLVLFLFRSMFKRVALLSLFSLSVFLLWFLPLALNLGLPQYSSFYSVYVELKTGIQYFIFEYGLVSDSITAFMLLLSLYAIFKVKGKSFVKEWAILAFFLPLLIGNRINEQLLFPVALLAAEVFINHWNRFWKDIKLDFVPVKVWTALFMLYVSVAAILAAGALMFFPPSAEEYHAMQWLSLHSPENAVVFADWFYGHWISAIAKRKNVMDAYAEYAPNLEQRFRDSNKILYGSDINVTISLLRKYNVSYVYYERPRDAELCSGFPYITRYPYFKKLYQDKRIYIYKVDYLGNSTPVPIC